MVLLTPIFDSMEGRENQLRVIIEQPRSSSMFQEKEMEEFEKRLNGRRVVVSQCPYVNRKYAKMTTLLTNATEEETCHLKPTCQCLWHRVKLTSTTAKEAQHYSPLFANALMRISMRRDESRGGEIMMTTADRGDFAILDSGATCISLNPNFAFVEKKYPEKTSIQPYSQNGEATTITGLETGTAMIKINTERGPIIARVYGAILCRGPAVIDPLA
ncbi:hypothetical protein TrCOL_g855, partial [Triparma columacea]